jgi:hypothetical protein
MARKTIVELTDDLDGKKAAETVSFSLDGRPMEIDLSSANAAKLRKALEPYIEAGRRVRGGTRASAAAPAGRTSEETHAIREWARASGYHVSSRGRISAEVLEAYNNAPDA